MSRSGDQGPTTLTKEQARSLLEGLARDIPPNARKVYVKMAEGESPRAAAEAAKAPIEDAWAILDSIGSTLGFLDRKKAHNILHGAYVLANNAPYDLFPDRVPTATVGPVSKARLRSAPSRGSAAPRAVPGVIEDMPSGENRFKPDPAVVNSMAELRRLLREYWEWAGEHGSRRVAAASDGAFSHATAAKLIAADPKVPLRLEYVAGMIRGCGGSDADQRAWVTTFRRVRATVRKPRLKVVGE